MGTKRTILVADIAGGTDRYATDGDTCAVGQERRCLAFMRSVLENAGGEVYREEGDRLDSAFTEPNAAAEAAERLRQQGRRPPAEIRLRRPLLLRMGFAHGRVEPEENVYRGSAAILATRLADLAEADEILTDETTRKRLSPAWAARLRFLANRVPRGYRVAKKVFEVMTNRSDTEVPTVGPSRRRAQLTMELRHGDRVWTLGPSRTRLYIGRDSRQDIRVDHEEVSRRHARLLWQPDQVELQDVSQNGSHVRVEGTWIRVHRGRTVLPDEGQICLGPRTLGPSPRVFDFACAWGDVSATEG